GGGGGNPGLAGVACSPSSVVSGGTTTCTVTLTQPAGANGTVVAVSSDNPSALAVPSSVTVPANATAAAFTGTAGSVTTSQVVTVTATLSAVSSTSTVTVSSSTAAVMGEWSGP